MKANTGLARQPQTVDRTRRSVCHLHTHVDRAGDLWPVATSRRHTAGTGSAGGLNPEELHRRQLMDSDVCTYCAWPLKYEVNQSMTTPSKAVGSSPMLKKCVVVNTVEGCQRISNVSIARLPESTANSVTYQLEPSVRSTAVSIEWLALYNTQTGGQEIDNCVWGT